MKNKKGIIRIILPIVIVLSLYIVFYSSIESKPTDAGFWFILALGISIGVAVCRFFEWKKNKNKV